MFNLVDTVRNAMNNAGVNLIDDGAAGPTLRIRTAADADLLVIDLNATAAFGASSSGIKTAAAPVSGGGAWATFSQNPSVSGTAAKAVWCDGDVTALFESTIGTVAAGTAEVQFDTLTFDTAVAATTSVAPTITVPASAA